MRKLLFALSMIVSLPPLLVAAGLLLLGLMYGVISEHPEEFTPERLIATFACAVLGGIVGFFVGWQCRR